MPGENNAGVSYQLPTHDNDSPARPTPAVRDVVQACREVTRRGDQSPCIKIPGFERFLSNAKSRGLEFAVFRDKRNIGEKELTYSGTGDIRIAPVVVGSKRGGILQTIAGAIRSWSALSSLPPLSARRSLVPVSASSLVA